MFEVCIISENTFSQFEKSLWLEKENVLNLLTFKKISDLNTGLGDIFNPEFKLEKLNLNTVDVLYTRTHTYQLIYGYEGNENYVSSVLNYKRNKISGLTVIVKFKIFNNDKEIKYQEESISNDDFINILRDMYYHKGFHISYNILLNDIEYDNKTGNCIL